jgi:hypothetical protein
MATVTVKSGAITNRDASPRVLNDAGLEGGRMTCARGTVEITSGNSIGSTYIMCQVPSNAYIEDVLVSSDDIGTATAGDIGIYQTTDNSNTVVDADFFASALSLKDGALAQSIALHESGVYGVEDIEKPLWEALGLSADPNRYYDVVLTLTAAADASGTFSLQVRYTK